MWSSALNFGLCVGRVADVVPDMDCDLVVVYGVEPFDPPTPR